MTLLLLIVVLLLVFGGGGYLGQGRFGTGAWSPLAIVLVILVVLYFSGRLRF